MRAGKYYLALLLCWLPLTAHAYPLAKDDPEVLARLHCRLLLRAQANDTTPLTGLVLREFMQPGDFAATPGPELEQQAWNTTHGLPDWGFLVGRRWDTASLAARQSANAAITQIILNRFSLPQADPNSLCRMDVSISLIEEPPAPPIRRLPKPNTPPVQPEPLVKGDGQAGAVRRQHAQTEGEDQPAALFREKAGMRANTETDKEPPPSLRALAKSSLPPTAEDDPPPLLYILERRPPAGWHITDLLINNQSLRNLYHDRLNRHIAEHGFGGINNMENQ